MDNKKEPSVLKDIMDTARDDILIPKAKDVVNSTLVDIIYMIGDYLANVVGKLVFGKDSVPKGRAAQNRTAYSNRSAQVRAAAQQPQVNIGNRASSDLQYVVVDTEEKARTIKDELIRSIQMYGQVRVADLYEKSGKVKPIFTDYNYGWTNVDDVSYRRNADGYWFNMPSPTKIK